MGSFSRTAEQKATPHLAKGKKQTNVTKEKILHHGWVPAQSCSPSRCFGDNTMLGAGLGSMVGKLTYGKRQWESLDSQMRKIIPPLHAAMEELLKVVDNDTNAFSEYMTAMKLPKSSQEEQEVREAAMQAGLKTAVGVPLQLAQKINTLWPSLLELAKCGNINCKSDLQVAARCLETAVHGARHNVDINLVDITDKNFTSDTAQLAKSEVDRAVETKEKILKELESRSS